MLWNTQLIVSITIVEIDAGDEWLGQAMNNVTYLNLKCSLCKVPDGCYLSLPVLNTKILKKKLLSKWGPFFTLKIFWKLVLDRNFLLAAAPFCSSQPSMVQWLSTSIFPFSSFVCCPAMVTPAKISTFFNICTHKSPTLTQYHLIPNSTKL